MLVLSCQINTCLFNIQRLIKILTERAEVKVTVLQIVKTVLTWSPPVVTWAPARVTQKHPAPLGVGQNQQIMSLSKYIVQVNQIN